MITIKEIAEQARKITLASGFHSPTLIVVGSLDGVVWQISDMPTNQQEKMRTFYMAGVSVSQQKEIGQLEAVFLITEGWMSRARDGRLPDVAPSKDPDRQEVLLITGARPAPGLNEFIAWEMLRDSAGKLTDIKLMPPTAFNGASVSSPLLEAFLEGYKIGVEQKAS